MIEAGLLVSLLGKCVINVSFIFKLLNLWEVIIKDKTNARLVSAPHGFLVMSDVTVDAQHVEVDIYGQDGVFGFHVKVRLETLTLYFVREKLGFQFDEVEGFSEFGLLRQDFDVEEDKLLVEDEKRFLH